jgi:protein-S-isoprenylcysteine O-methyltransferase Ste14
MPDVPLLLVALVVSVYWAGVGRMVVRVRRRTRRDVGVVPQQPKERLLWLVWAPLVVGWIALPWVATARADAPWAVPALSGALPGAARIAAALVALACFAMTVRCWNWMGERWRMDVALDAKGELITDGPFCRIRHPIYAWQALLMICTAVVLPTPPMLALAAVHLVLVNVKARNEERHLLASHGESYARYVERTGRFLPRFGGRAA